VIFSDQTVTPNNSSDPPRLLNYLTAPHVLVWSASVASSSLPGVFEANRLKVRDADGTERYESAEGAKFSDGSMEQDLPMAQLSEMFNVNHFIISQANPHAVMFASYNQERSVWHNPILGMINAVSHFLKERVRTWLANFVELIGARRIAPAHATSRFMSSQFFTQEYEGRDCDISLIPWLNHRGLWSAILHVLYNPSEDEFREWIEAAERETWTHIPAIKSHIAEEVTLDRCVQRLRKRVVAESWQKRRNDSTNQKMGERVPSFFTSPSLVNLSGLGVGDQTNIEVPGDYHGYSGGVNIDQPAATVDPPSRALDINVNSGWAGMGLRGNRSSGNLERSTSHTSGLFIDGEEPPPSMEQQMAGEESVPTFIHSSSTPTLKEAMDTKGYFKTTSMANFYYRKTGSYGNFPRSRSAEGLADMASDGSVESKESVTNKTTRHERQKSKSHTDLKLSFK
jgi:predicted acylesterase/phospholipase RssA